MGNPMFRKNGSNWERVLISNNKSTIVTQNPYDYFVGNSTVKVQLINDSTGVIENEYTADNYIASNLALLMKQQARNLIGYGNGTNNHRLGSSTMSYSSAISYFNTLILSANSDAVDVNSSYSNESTPIGYASKTEEYTGTDTLVGTVVKALSYTDDRKLHYEFEFGTTKANGTFNSAIFSDSATITKMHNIIESVFPNIPVAPYSVSTLFHMFEDDNYHYYELNLTLPTRKGVRRVSKSDPNTFNDYDTGINYNYRGSCTDGTYIYISTNDTTNPVAKFDYSFNFIGYICAVGYSHTGISYYDGYLWACKYGSPYNILKFNMSGALVQTITVASMNNNTAAAVVASEVGFFTVNDQTNRQFYQIALDGSSSKPIKNPLLHFVYPHKYEDGKVYGAGRYLRSTYPNTGFEVNTNIYTTTITTVDVTKPMNYGSRCVFPSSITKTSSQRMKIIYDLEFN